MMSSKGQHVVPRGNGWAVQRSGAERASGIFTTQQEAIERAREIVFVALDGPEGKPVPVPPWTPSDESDQRLADYALNVMSLSKDIEQAIAKINA